MTWQSIEALAQALVMAHDRHGARTLSAILTEVGRADPTYHATIATATAMDCDAALDMGHPTHVHTLVSAIAAHEGEPLCSLDVAAGLRAVGIYHRTIAAVGLPQRRASRKQ
jgi:hypothetical protein